MTPSSSTTIGWKPKSAGRRPRSGRRDLAVFIRPDGCEGAKHDVHGISPKKSLGGPCARREAKVKQPGAGANGRATKNAPPVRRKGPKGFSHNEKETNPHRLRRRMGRPSAGRRSGRGTAASSPGAGQPLGPRIHFSSTESGRAAPTAHAHGAASPRGVPIAESSRHISMYLSPVKGRILCHRERKCAKTVRSACCVPTDCRAGFLRMVGFLGRLTTSTVGWDRRRR